MPQQYKETIYSWLPFPGPPSKNSMRALRETDPTIWINLRFSARFDLLLWWSSLIYLWNTHQYIPGTGCSILMQIHRKEASVHRRHLTQSNKMLQPFPGVYLCISEIDQRLPSQQQFKLCTERFFNSVCWVSLTLGSYAVLRG